MLYALVLPSLYFISLTLNYGSQRLLWQFTVVLSFCCILHWGMQCACTVLTCCWVRWWVSCVWIWCAIVMWMWVCVRPPNWWLSLSWFRICFILPSVMTRCRWVVVGTCWFSFMRRWPSSSAHLPYCLTVMFSFCRRSVRLVRSLSIPTSTLCMFSFPLFICLVFSWPPGYPYCWSSTLDPYSRWRTLFCYRIPFWFIWVVPWCWIVGICTSLSIVIVVYCFMLFFSFTTSSSSGWSQTHAVSLPSLIVTFSAIDWRTMLVIVCPLVPECDGW